MAENYVITIARGFGSGGKTIGVQLARELGIECYENRILDLASQNTGIDLTKYEAVDEKVPGSAVGRMLRLLQTRLVPYPEPNAFEAKDEIFATQRDVILELARTESCIIVGKAADFLLQDFDNVLSVYIEAPRPFCRERVIERLHVTEAEADEMIERTDRYRSEYYTYYTGGRDWRSPINYDLTINSERITMEKTGEMIKLALKLKFGDDVLEKMGRKNP